jgi:hypothetical protein
MWMWDGRTHQHIAQAAVERSNSFFQAQLKLYQPWFINGLEAPDRILRDYYNHCYHCTPVASGRHYGGAVQRVTELYTQLKAAGSYPETLAVAASLPSYLAWQLNNPAKRFFFICGLLIHYLSDLHQPFHTDGTARFAHEETVHMVMEQDIRLHLDQLPLVLQRRRRIKDMQSYCLDAAHRANSRYDQLIDAYFLRPGKVQPQRWIQAQPTLKLCLEETAQSVADFLLSAEEWVRGFEPWYQHDKLLINVETYLHPGRRYRLRHYHTGTISCARYKP